MLCSNRPEGFGPHSTLSAPIPTSCFVDVILVPLPVWIALLLLPAFFLLSTRHQKPSYYPDAKARKSWLYKLTATLYYVLIVCNILMQTLEIVRLSLIHYGIGLLPFTYVGLILGAGLHWSRGARGKITAWQSINLVIWVGAMIMAIVKVVGLDKQGIDGRKGSKYLVSDQLLDVSVIAGVYAVIAILEVILGIQRARRTRQMEGGY